MRILNWFQKKYRELITLRTEKEFGEKDKQGRRQGVWEKYYAYLLGRYTYKDDVLEGPFEEYHFGGQVKVKGNYKGGELEGMIEEYYKGGQIRGKRNFKGGQLDGIEEEYSLYKTSKLFLKCSNKNGLKHGPYEEYFSDGKIRIKTVYNNGRKDGLYEEYYENGQLNIRGTYKNGVKDGLYEEYDENGKLKEKAVYCNGQKLTKDEAEDYMRRQEEKQALKDAENAREAAQKAEEEKTKAIMRKMLEEEMSRRKNSQNHTEPEETIDHTLRQKKLLEDIKAQLAVAGDISQKPIGRANTPERQAEAEKLVLARRQAEVLNRATRKILSGGNKELEEKMAQTTDQAKLSALYREAYAKLSDDDKKLCAKIGKETGAIMTKAKDTLEKERRFLRTRRKSGIR